MKDYEAKTIINQLGGRAFVLMTGAKQFVVDGRNNTLQFRIGRNCKSINVVRMTLTVMDDYTVEFSRLRAGTFKIVNKVTGRSDQLKITWAAGNACDYGWYSIDNGKTWVGGLSYPDQIINGFAFNSN